MTQILPYLYATGFESALIINLFQKYCMKECVIFLSDLGELCGSNALELQNGSF